MLSTQEVLSSDLLKQPNFKQTCTFGKYQISAEVRMVLCTKVLCNNVLEDTENFNFMIMLN